MKFWLVFVLVCFAANILIDAVAWSLGFSTPPIWEAPVRGFIESIVAGAVGYLVASWVTAQ